MAALADLRPDATAFAARASVLRMPAVSSQEIDDIRHTGKAVRSSKDIAIDGNLVELDIEVLRQPPSLPIRRFDGKVRGQAMGGGKLSGAALVLDHGACRNDRAAGGQEAKVAGGLDEFQCHEALREPPDSMGLDIANRAALGVA